ncbi:MAG TPA: PPE family protein [Mycobacterium sp.]|nr:PPE family protein [Mycobacterium sp.]
MDFAALPPEVNSAMIYAGPGSAPMMAAAAAYNRLGAELTTTSTNLESVISMLSDEEWRGTASAAMAAAAQPFVTWLNTTAEAMQQAASQATASAGAYETAHATVVPPAAVAANRVQLATLVATNFLGQNTAAIAANEALYGEMWVQDATAMYAYAAASASAAVLQPLTAPTPNTNPAGLAGQAAAVGQASAAGAQSQLSQAVAGLPGAMQTLASPLAATAPSTQAGLGDFLSNFINSTQNIGIWNALQTYSAYLVNAGIWHIFAGAASAIAIASPGIGQAAGGIALVDAPAPAPGIPTAPATLGSAPVLASAGQASAVGGLSVPGTWSAATPEAAAPATLTGAGWTAGADEGGSMTAMPAGMPAVASANRGSFGFGTPRYGFKPTVMTRPVAAG